MFSTHEAAALRLIIMSRVAVQTDSLVTLILFFFFLEITSYQGQQISRDLREKYYDLEMFSLEAHNLSLKKTSKDFCNK